MAQTDFGNKVLSTKLLKRLNLGEKTEKWLKKKSL